VGSPKRRLSGKESFLLRLSAIERLLLGIEPDGFRFLLKKEEGFSLPFFISYYS